MCGAQENSPYPVAIVQWSGYGANSQTYIYSKTRTVIMPRRSTIHLTHSARSIRAYQVCESHSTLQYVHVSVGRRCPEWHSETSFISEQIGYSRHICPAIETPFSVSYTNRWALCKPSSVRSSNVSEIIRLPLSLGQTTGDQG
jgi:hypothetical protein